MAALGARLRDQRGIAVPSVIILIAIGTAFATAAALAAVTALRGTVRDHDSKAALAAANSGVDVALYRQNEVLLTDDSTFCLVESVTSLVLEGPLGDGWCGQKTGTVGDAQYDYRAKVERLNLSQRRLSIVSTGTAGEVSRRVAVSAYAPTGEALLGDSGAIGLNSLTIGGASSVELPPGATSGGAASNGDIVLEDSGQLCGSAQYGTGHGVVEEGSATFPTPGCPGGEGEGFLTLGRPVLPATNDNGRITAAGTTGNDTVSPTTALGNPNRFSWDPNTRELALKSNTTLTLGGSNYVLCKLEMEGNSTLVVAGPTNARTRIYFDSPENCGYGGGATQLSMIGQSSIVATGGNANAAAFLMVGSDSEPVPNVVLSGNAKQNEFMLYAPGHDVTVTGNSTYLGGIAGLNTSLNGSATIQIPSSITNFSASVLIRFVRERFVECNAVLPTGGAPDASC